MLINDDQLHPDAEKISKDLTAKPENRTIVDEPITDGKPVKSKSVSESLMQKSDLDSSSQNAGSKQPEAAEDEPLIRLRLEHGTKFSTYFKRTEHTTFITSSITCCSVEHFLEFQNFQKYVCSADLETYCTISQPTQ